ncbi:hypothetical protein A9R04_25760 [Nocardiopsis dassonvillei]|uniref:hypothetical protein n=1 Tax=Nocardiopsis dassonvillei TaxID=2014 RepID=UPI0008FC6076|nr:hypothetical protein [Nocardiopsis dassonvillei]APC37869.1 hypothetical protein A9R04_25760 [Nocardiopsis dassonvillei]
MPIRGIAFAHTAFLLLSALLSFLVARELLEATPDPEATLVQVHGGNTAAGQNGVSEAIVSFAEEHRVNIALETADVRDPGGLRHLHMAVGNPEQPGASWLDEGYPGLSLDHRTEVHPWNEAAELDPRGTYHLFGEEGSATAFLDAMSVYGLDGYVAPEYQTVEWFEIVRDAALFDAFTVALLCGVIGIATSVLLNARSYAVLRLHGMSPSRILLRDLRQLAPYWSAVAVITAMLMTALLYVHGALPRWGLLLEVALFYLSAFSAAGVVAHVAALALVHATDVLPALKGRLAVRLATVSTYAVRVPALVLVLGLMASLALSLQVLQGQRQAHEAFTEAGDISRFHFSQSADELQGQETTQAFGESLRALDEQGRLLLAAPGESGSILRTTAVPEDLTLIVVNDTYLRRHPVLDPEGRPYGPSTGSDEVRVLVPETHADLTAVLQEEVGLWLRESWETNDGVPPRTRVDTAPSQAGQQLFTYGATPLGTQNDVPFARDPVIVAVPNGSAAPHPFVHYHSYATMGAALPLDREGALEVVEEQALSAYVDSVQPVALAAADEYREVSAQVRMEAATLIAAFCVLLVTGITVCVVHARAHGQLVLARHLHGWRFLTTHRSLMTLEVVLAVCFVGWAVWNTMGNLAFFDASSAAVPSDTAMRAVVVEPFMAAGISVSSLGLMVAVLALFHRRIVRESSAAA